MKKYIAPMVQITALMEEQNLLDASNPNRHVTAVTSDGSTIDVMPSGSGSGSGSGGSSGPSTSGGNLNYSKGYDSWTLWDE